MKMDLNYLKKLIKMLDSSNLAELEIVEEGTKIKLSKPRPKITAGIGVPGPLVTDNNFTIQTNSKPDVSKELEVKVEVPNENHIEIKSPMVGTFYKAPSPESEAYVQVGSIVKEGTVLCIIEAMKLMNEIESEYNGKIVKILVDNGHAVEYDQPLFLLEKS